MPHPWKHFGQVGWDPEVPDLVSGSLAHGKELGLYDLRDSFQSKPFYGFLVSEGHTCLKQLAKSSQH